MIRTALLSKWHVHAEEYAQMAAENSSIEIAAVWDEEEERGRKWAEELGVSFEGSLDRILQNPEIHAVIVSSPTNLHKEVILKAAREKKHIFTEKVLAFTVSDCMEIYETVKENKVKLMVSLPRLTFPQYVFAQEAAESGILGKITSIRCRVAHNGAVPEEGNPNGWLPDHFFDKAACGGGALIDLGAHPIYLTNRIAGEAKAVTASFQHTFGHEVEDYAAVTVEYESGIHGIIETGFVSYGSPSLLEIYGTEGTLLIEEERIRLKSIHKNNGEWTGTEFLPAPLPMPMMQWTEAIANDKEPDISEWDVLHLTLINEAAALSAEKKGRVEVKDLTEPLNS